MASERAAARRAPPFIDPPGYAQHRPEAALLYRLVEQHYPALVAAREATGRPLPKYVQDEFDSYTWRAGVGGLRCVSVSVALVSSLIGARKLSAETP
jgi:hypothetical protein